MRFFELYERLAPQGAATIVFNKQGNILILQRGHTAPWMPLRWNLPGGMVEAGENPLQGAKREAWEEARIKPKNMKFVKVVKDDQYDLHIFTGEVDSDKVNLGDMENIKYAWIKPSDLDKYSFVPYTKEILTKAFGVVQECLTEYYDSIEVFDNYARKVVRTEPWSDGRFEELQRKYWDDMQHTVRLK